jgi:Tol biopolymer transport system component
MQMTKFSLICIEVSISVLLISSIGAQENSFPVLRGPYLGQDPPGTTPVYFAPGIVSVEENFEHRAAIFSPDGNEVFWCTNVDSYTERGQSGMLRLYFMKIVNGIWSAPKRATFVENLNIERPTFSPCGRWLFYEYYADPGNPDDVDIFVVERQGEAWSKPEPVSSLINTTGIERIQCFTADGSFYFSRNPFSPREEMFVAKWQDGEFGAPEKLGDDYDSDVAEYALVIGPNEAYMLICQQAAPASANVFVSYKNADGTWSDRVRTPYYSGGFLALSPDGRYLFMENEGICWVSTSFVEDLRP